MDHSNPITSSPNSREIFSEGRVTRSSPQIQPQSSPYTRTSHISSDNSQNTKNSITVDDDPANKDNTISDPSVSTVTSSSPTRRRSTAIRSSFISKCASIFRPRSSRHSRNKSTNSHIISNPPMAEPDATQSIYHRGSIVVNKPLPALPIYKNTDGVIIASWNQQEYKPWWETRSASRRTSGHKNISGPDDVAENEVEMTDLCSARIQELTDITLTPVENKRYGIQYSHSHPELQRLRRSLDAHDSDCKKKEKKCVVDSESEYSNDDDHNDNEDEEEIESTTDDGDEPITPDKPQHPPGQHKSQIVKPEIMDYSEILDLYLDRQAISVYDLQNTPTRSPLDRVKDAARRISVRISQERKAEVGEIGFISGDDDHDCEEAADPTSPPKQKTVNEVWNVDLKDLMRQGREVERRRERVENIMAVMRDGSD